MRKSAPAIQTFSQYPKTMAEHPKPSMAHPLQPPEFPLSTPLFHPSTHRSPQQLQGLLLRQARDTPLR